MSHIIIAPSGKTVDCAHGDTVLMALEKAGYALPNNCRAGACGECKVKVTAGHFDQGMVLDMALSEQERKQGYGLMCMAKPISDEITIEWGTADAKPKLFPPREDALFVLTDKRMLTHRVVELRLRPVGQAIRFWPGQYITLGKPKEGIPNRAFSIANAPRPDGELVLQIARAQGGTTSQWVHEQLNMGDSLKVSGAYGTFIGDPSVDTPVLCIAAGTGLAPILSLTEAALRRGYKRPVHLLVCASTQQDVYAQGLMAWWRTKHRQFDYTLALSRETLPGFEAGRIDVVLPKRFPNLSKHSIFIAGSPGFVDTSLATVRALGGQESLIHKESFVHQRLI